MLAFGFLLTLTCLRNMAANISNANVLERFVAGMDQGVWGYASTLRVDRIVGGDTDHRHRKRSLFRFLVLQVLGIRWRIQKETYTKIYGWTDHGGWS